MSAGLGGSAPLGSSDRPATEVSTNRRVTPPSWLQHKGGHTGRLSRAEELVKVGPAQVGVHKTDPLPPACAAAGEIGGKAVVQIRGRVKGRRSCSIHGRGW